MSYTKEISAREPEASRRRGLGRMPRSRLVDAGCALLSVPYGAAASAGLLVPGFLMLPLFLIKERRGPHANRSNEAGGSLSAIKTLNARAVMARIGVGPDALAPKLMAPLSLTGPGTLGWLYTHAYDRSLVAGFALTRRLWVEQALRPFLGKVMKFVDTGYLQMRTCWLDDVVKRFIEDRAGQPGQLVILGAGYDTRCLRLAPQDSIRSFEVDAPGTQAQKRALMTQVGVDDSKVRYVPCDFGEQDWLRELEKAGFDPTVPACFVWEGVSMYLPREVVIATLQKVKSLAPGSIIGFDCLSAAWIANPAMTKMTQRAGEPWRFGLDAGDVQAFIEGAGLRCLDNLRHEELLRRYTPADARGHSLAACIDFGAFLLAGN